MTASNHDDQLSIARLTAECAHLKESAALSYHGNQQQILALMATDIKQKEVISSLAAETQEQRQMIETLMSSSNQMKQELQEKDVVISSLGRQLADLVFKHAAAEKLSTERNETVTILQQDKCELAQKLSDFEQNKKEIAAQLLVSNQVISELKQRLSESKIAISSLNHNLSASTQSCIDLERENKLLQLSNSQLVDQVKEQNIEIKSFSLTIEKLKSTIDENGCMLQEQKDSSDKYTFSLLSQIEMLDQQVSEAKLSIFDISKQLLSATLKESIDSPQFSIELEHPKEINIHLPNEKQDLEQRTILDQNQTEFKQTIEMCRFKIAELSSENEQQKSKLHETLSELEVTKLKFKDCAFALNEMKARANIHEQSIFLAKHQTANAKDAVTTENCLSCKVTKEQLDEEHFRANQLGRLVNKINRNNFVNRYPKVFMIYSLPKLMFLLELDCNQLRAEVDMLQRFLCESYF